MILCCHAVCTWKLWNLPLSGLVYEGIRLNLINPRVLKTERRLHVNMLDSAPLRFDRERMQLVYEIIFKIIFNIFKK